MGELVVFQGDSITHGGRGETEDPDHYLPTSPNPDLRETWAAHVGTHAAIVRELAVSHGAVFVPYQQAMDAAALRAPASYWIWDGVHPTYAGQRIVADTWRSLPVPRNAVRTESPAAAVIRSTGQFASGGVISNAASARSAPR
jgi:hypothetical protein